MLHHTIFLLPLLLIISMSMGTEHSLSITTRKKSNDKSKNKLLLKKMLTAIEKDSVHVVESILQVSTNLLYKNKRIAQHLLATAVIFGKPASAELLLLYNANPNMLTAENDSLLHFVKDTSTAEVLICYGARVGQKNKKGRTPFFKAIQKLNFDVAQVFIEKGADINEGDNKENTPLHYVVVNATIPAIFFLLFHGADADKPNSDGVTADQMALKCGGDVLGAFYDCKRILFPFIPVDVRFNNKLRHSWLMKLLSDEAVLLKEILALDSSGYCSSDIAAIEDGLKKYDSADWSIIESHLSYYGKEPLGLIKFIARRTSGRKQLLDALKNDEFCTVYTMLEENPYLLHTYCQEYAEDELSIEFANKFISCAYYLYDRIKCLLHAGFDLNIRDDTGKTLLCHMIMSGNSNEKIVDLLDSGVSVNMRDNRGNSPLFYALLLGDERQVCLLLRYGAAVNINMLPHVHDLYPMVIVDAAYKKQKCRRCKSHADDISNIPCLNQHRGKFICKNCYLKDAHCPICQRDLDEYGA